MRRLIGEWRPPLSAVVLGILLTVLALPLVGLFFFRLYENLLIRQTEGELIAQAATLAAVYTEEVKAANVPPAAFGVTASPPATAYFPDGRYTPIEPKLDLTVDAILPPRPEMGPTGFIRPDEAFADIGRRMTPVLSGAQKVMLSGYRLIDPKGIVIAGQQEMGTSLAHIPEVAEALRGNYASVLRQRISDEPPPSLYSISRGAKVRVFVAMPAVVDGRVAGVVYLSRTPNNVVKHLYGERGKVALVALTTLAGALLIGFVFVRVISRPMHELLDRTRRISAGDDSAIRPLSHHGTREMAQLSTGFLSMARKLQDRSDTLKTFATHVSHELKSPLTSIQGAAELLRDGGEEMNQAERHRFHDNIVKDTERLNVLVRRLIELARAENVGPQGESSTLAGALGHVVMPNEISVQIDKGADLPFKMSAENMAIILTNLADNSARHGASSLVLSAKASGEKVELAAEDDGSGIDPENRDKVFEPFFTTRRQTGGTGLGLGIVTALVKAHSGAIRLGKATTGARFELELPAA